MSRHKGGPIPKPLGQLKSCRTTVWSTQDQLVKIDELKGHYSRSEWLLLCGLGHDPAPPAVVIPEVNLIAWADVKQGPMSNLHQSMYVFNRLEKIMPGQGYQQVAQEAGEIIEILHRVRDGLFGVGIDLRARGRP